MFRLAVLIGGLAAVAMAQAGDPPSRVARLNYMNGPVSFRPGSVEEWTAATLNYPLTNGDHLWADNGAQAEMHIGSTAIRMDSQTALAVLNLNDQMTQLSLTQGSLNVHIRFLDQQENFEVDTPNVAISLLRPGDYRINADGDNNVTVVSVRGGEAEVTGGVGAFPVHPGESAQLSGAGQVSQQMGQALPPDGFDQWCETRNAREERSVSARYVPREMIGYEDLDEYGVWREVPQYGWVWAPRTMVVGWAPYRYGHWAWVEPWGWTWIDDAPWGFAPFHYGRWAFYSGSWLWVPGQVVVGVRPVYAPALVAFVGGPGFGMSVRVGGGGFAAWFPLGPGEVYHPAYHVSEVYVRQVNIMHVTNINVVNVRYVNRDVAGAVTVVPHDAFVSARPIHSAVVVVPRGEIERAQVIGTTAAIVPVRESVLGRPGGVMVVHAPPPRFAERVVVARATPPPPPVAFAAKEQALRANPGRPLDGGTIQALRANNPGRAPMVRTVAPAAQSVGAPSPGRQFGGPPARNDRPASARPSYGGAPSNQSPQQPRYGEQPAQRPVERPVQPNVQQPVQRPAEQPVQRNVEQPRVQQAPVQERRNEQQRNDRPQREQRKGEKKEEKKG